MSHNRIMNYGMELLKYFNIVCEIQHPVIHVDNEIMKIPKTTTCFVASRLVGI